MTNPTLADLIDQAKQASTDAAEAGAALEAEGRKIQESLKRADALAAFIIEHALSETLSTHVEISFEPHTAAMIASMAEAYRKGRGEVSSQDATA